ncbi:hypothetical protein GOP47_0024834 [Adiantum capillus-veneris]|uniref:Uncharacterized protein n=1 Tax=Adiantum capillus-veneris TaxID=13818 RepID=A0A9D4Z404_ADICA|nr:hypothetical protein GOP47_0024834 [Adiantum capillus-veneris]
MSRKSFLLFLTAFKSFDCWVGKVGRQVYFRRLAAAVKLTAWTRRSCCALRGLRISAIRKRASRGRSGSVHVSLSPASAHLRRQHDKETKTMDERRRTQGGDVSYMEESEDRDGIPDVARQLYVLDLLVAPCLFINNME